MRKSSSFKRPSSAENKGKDGEQSKPPDKEVLQRQLRDLRKKIDQRQRRKREQEMEKLPEVDNFIAEIKESRKEDDEEEKSPGGETRNDLLNILENLSMRTDGGNEGGRRESGSPGNISQMRKALGSEKLVRELSQRTINEMTNPFTLEGEGGAENEENDKSIFERDSYQDF